MLTLDGSVKLIDMGLCSELSSKGGSVNEMVGSPHWMPPEMIWRKECGTASDMWSFGVCLLECFFGCPPNQFSSIKAMFVTGTRGLTDFIDNGNFSPDVKDFLQSCLHVDPGARKSAPELSEHSFICSSDKMTRANMGVIFSEIFGNKSKKLATNWATKMIDGIPPPLSSTLVPNLEGKTILKETPRIRYLPAPNTTAISETNSPRKLPREKIFSSETNSPRKFRILTSETNSARKNNIEQSTITPSPSPRKRPSLLTYTSSKRRKLDFE